MNPEYSEEFEQKPLPLKLFNDYDTEEEIPWKKRLEALVNGHITPREAALEFDTAVVQQAGQRLQSLLQRPDPRHLTSDEDAQGIPSMRAIAPNPRGDLEYLMQSIARLCSVFPPYNPGQDRILGFLEELRALPRHDVPDGVPPEDPTEPYPKITLWPFKGSWETLPETFRVEELACQPPLRWRNYQSSLARLTTLDLVNCGFLSSLEHLLPYSREYPDLNKRPLDGPNKIGNYLIGAAQWIIYPHEGQYVYEQCCWKGERVSGENPREMWSMERWREWKGQFGFVAGDERFQRKYREMARVAYEKMLECEEAHSGDVFT